VRRVAFALGLVVGVVAPAPAQRARHVNITRADIEAAGWMRISEVLDGAEGWQFTSTDGFTLSPTSDGLPAAGASATGTSMPAIILDGVRVPVTIFGLQQLDLLPITLAQIDSVTFTRGPVIAAGRIEPRGVIAFYSHRPPPGANAQGEFQVGDVANKPGLYQYTPMRPFNREHHGPFEHLLLALADGRIGAELGVRYSTLNTSDTLIGSRIRFGAIGATNQINLAVPTAHVVVDALGGRQTLDAGHAHYSGLFFVPALGHEQSMRMNATTVNASGLIALPAAVALTYRAGLTSDDIGRLPSPSPFTLAGRHRMTGASAELARTLGRALISLGTGSESWTLTRPGLAVVQRTDNHLIASAATGGDDGWSSNIVTELTRSGGITNAGAVIRSRLALGTADVVAVDASLTTRDTGADGAWIDPLAVGAPPTHDAQRTAVLGASWTHTLVSSLALFGGAEYRRVSGWAVAIPSDTGFFELRGNTPPAPIIGTLGVASTRLGIEVPSTKRWHARLAYTYTASITGDSALRTADRSIARHQLIGGGWLVPGHDWRIGTRVDVASGTYWSAFPALPNGFPPTVPGLRRIDISAEKWVWRRHVRFQYLVRDVLNGVERWQPRSAEFNLRWFAAASFTTTPGSS
jgi:hypothetical protein